MQTIVQELDEINGYVRKKISFIHKPKRNVLKDAQRWFTKEEKKEAKLNYKNQKKNERCI